MQLKDVMTPNVECVAPEATLRDAAKTMRDKDIGAIPVCENDRLTGMITDRDIVVRAVAEGRNPVETTVREAMSKGVDFCFEDDDLSKAVELMEHKKIRRLVVLDGNKQLCGIVSLGDLAVKAGREPAAEALEQISEPAHPR